MMLPFAAYVLVNVPCREQDLGDAVNGIICQNIVVAKCPVAGMASALSGTYVLPGMHVSWHHMCR